MPDAGGPESIWVLIDSAQTSTTSAPTAATDGIDAPGDVRRDTLNLELRKTISGGVQATRVKVLGYRDHYYTASGTPQALTRVETGGWSVLFDVTVDATMEASSFNRTYKLRGIGGYKRFDTQIVTNGGTDASLTTLLGFDPFTQE